MHKRKMSSDDARERITAQSPQEIKVKAADVVIQNNESFEETWKQVLAAWKVTVPSEEEKAPVPERKAKVGELIARRARPQEAEDIAAFITHITAGHRTTTRSDIMAAFGEKAFLLLYQDQKIVGILGWQVENLVARVDDVYLEASIPMAEAMKVMTAEVEKASRELQCEAALLFLPPDLAQYNQVWKALDYSARAVKELGVRAWQDAAMESMPPGTVMLFKQLRKDRVLRPV
jgi:dephospho-CoA kinase